MLELIAKKEDIIRLRRSKWVQLQLFGVRKKKRVGVATRQWVNCLAVDCIAVGLQITFKSMAAAH
jgi:hypothetical protein